ncbi:MAG: hypothetical protein ABIR68_04950 [Ilumatobacteraceae bacterium]
MIVLVVVLALVVVAIAAAAARARHKPAVQRVYIDPFTIGEPWRRHVSAAQSTQRRFEGIVAAVPAGPLHDRLAAIGRQVQHGVEEGWQIAKRGDEVDDALKRIDTPSIRAQLDRAADDAKASLQTQLDTGFRIRATRDDTDQRLRSLNMRLDQLVAQAAEVSLGSDTTADLGSGVDAVIIELEALRQAMNEINSLSGGSTASVLAGLPPLEPIPAPPAVATPPMPTALPSASTEPTAGSAAGSADPTVAGDEPNSGTASPST